MVHMRQLGSYNTAQPLCSTKVIIQYPIHIFMAQNFLHACNSVVACTRSELMKSLGNHTMAAYKVPGIMPIWILHPTALNVQRTLCDIALQSHQMINKTTL